jgi:transcription elongation GreA/GreB family factor
VALKCPTRRNVPIAATAAARREGSMMPRGIDKSEILRALRARLGEAYARLAAAQAAAQAGAVHAEAKQEHAKDMRSTEASYLSRGLAERVETLADAVRVLDVFAPRPRGADAPIGLGDLVVLADEDGTETAYFLAPVGGGEKLEVGGRVVLVLTPRAPLGEALLERLCGDEVALDLPGGRRTLEIVRVD